MEILTSEERIALLEAHARPGLIGGHALKQYEATILAVEAERDVYKAFFAWWIGGEGLDSVYVEMLPLVGDMDDYETAKFRAALDGVKAVREAMP